MLFKHNFFCLRTEIAHPNTAELHLHNITVKVQDLFVKLRYEESYKRYTMKQPHLCFAIAGICLGVVSCGHGQPVAHDSMDLSSKVVVVIRDRVFVYELNHHPGLRQGLITSRRLWSYVR